MTDQKPIPLDVLRRALQKVKEMEDKATKGPWEKLGLSVVVDGHGTIATIPTPKTTGVFECSVNVEAICLARTLLPAVVETVEKEIKWLELLQRTTIVEDNIGYPVAAALVAYFESEGGEK